jgi:hypothetical protein
MLTPLTTTTAPTGTVTEEICEDGNPCVYLAYSDFSTTRIHIAQYEPLTRGGIWIDRADLFGGARYSTLRKVGFAWQKWASHATGRFWLAWTLPNPPGTGAMPLLSFTATDTLGGTPTFQASPGTLRNGYSQTSQGIDLLAERGKVREVDASLDAPDGFVGLRFYQNLDGTYDWALYDNNDWFVLGYNVCRSLRDVRGDRESFCLHYPEDACLPFCSAPASGVAAGVTTVPSENGGWVPAEEQPPQCRLGAR